MDKLRTVRECEFCQKGIFAELRATRSETRLYSGIIISLLSIIAALLKIGVI